MSPLEIILGLEFLMLERSRWKDLAVDYAHRSCSVEGLMFVVVFADVCQNRIVSISPHTVTAQLTTVNLAPKTTSFLHCQIVAASDSRLILHTLLRPGTALVLYLIIVATC